MLNRLRERVSKAIQATVDSDVLARIDRIDARFNEYGVDPFGLDPEWVKNTVPVARFLYDKYFRVQTFGIERVPEGRVLLIGNHSGQLPLDAMMIITALVLEGEPPRMVRSMVEHWVASLPIFSYLYPRMGQIVGTRENCIRLLEQEQPILAFPEGVRGLNKPFAKRYQLQGFGLGFMRLALMTKAPIVPVAVVGAEEQAPALADLSAAARTLGFPAFPITPTFPWLGPLGLLPLPTRYRIYFGEPMHFTGNPDDEDAVVGEKARRVRQAITRMLRDGVKERKSVFW